MKPKIHVHLRGVTLDVDFDETKHPRKDNGQFGQGSGSVKPVKRELMGAFHNFIATNVARAVNTPDIFKAALYLASASLGAGTTGYVGTGEVSGTNYTAGGIVVTNAAPPASAGTTAYWTPSASLAWVNVTLSVSFDAVLIYNSSQGDKAVAVYTFGAQTVTAGNFTLTMPANAANTALIQLA